MHTELTEEQLVHIAGRHQEFYRRALISTGGQRNACRTFLS